MAIAQDKTDWFLEMEEILIENNFKLFHWTNSLSIRSKVNLQVFNAWLIDARTNFQEFQPTSELRTVLTSKECDMINSYGLKKRIFNSIMGERRDRLEEASGHPELFEKYLILALETGMPLNELVLSNPIILERRKRELLGFSSNYNTTELQREKRLAVVRAFQLTKSFEEAQDMLKSMPLSWFLKVSEPEL